MRLKAEVFIDAGGFDGDTTELFCQHCPDYHKVYFFEPSEINMRNAKYRLAGTPNIVYLQKGISDRVERLAFDQSAGASCAVLNSSYELNDSDAIELTTIDASISEPATFIKMDLEGWERFALMGAMQQITRYHPKLAIAVYHKGDDIWRLPKIVLSMRDDYQIFLRHYTEGWSETVMYFLPIH